MADVAVAPEHLDKLATAQDQASTQARTAASAASNLEVAVWVSHGVVSKVICSPAVNHSLILPKS